MVHQLTVAADDDGQRLDRYLKKHAPHVPYGMVQKWIRKGSLRINKKRVKADYRLKAGEVIVLPEFAERDKAKASPPPKPSWLDDAVLFQDSHTLILNKPAGVATQGGTGIKQSIDSLLPHLARDDETLRLCHRLDKETSGVLVVAKSREAAQYYGDLFKKSEVKKTYVALCVGKPHPMEGAIKAPLRAKAYVGGEEKTIIDEEEGKKAVTHYRVLENVSDVASLIELVPETGRTHQLRVHMEMLESPICGDKKYGEGQTVEGLSNRLHLHAYAIECIPFSESRSEIFYADPPNDFSKSLSFLGISNEPFKR